MDASKPPKAEEASHHDRKGEVSFFPVELSKIDPAVKSCF
jgi:hypothetical protein